jgi:hypothetical protein
VAIFSDVLGSAWHRSGHPLIRILRQHRHGQTGDAIFVQRAYLVGRRLAINPARGGFVEVNFPRFLGELRPGIIGLSDDQKRPMTIIWPSLVLKPAASLVSPQRTIRVRRCLEKDLAMPGIRRRSTGTRSPGHSRFRCSRLCHCRQRQHQRQRCIVQRNRTKARVPHSRSGRFGVDHKRHTTHQFRR